MNKRKKIPESSGRVQSRKRNRLDTLRVVCERDKRAGEGIARDK